MQFDLKALIDLLNPVCRKALEAAAGLCVSQTNYNVEIEHVLLKLLELPDTDVQRLLRYYEVPTATVMAELTRAMEQLPRGNCRTPTLSPHIPHWLQEAWLLASLHLGASRVRSGAVLMALLEHDSLRGVLLESAPTLFQMPREALRQDIRDLLRGTGEDVVPVAPTGDIARASATAPGGSASKTPALDQYTIDLTARARAGLIDPVQGRDVEIRQTIDILTRRRQNNPILTGEAGVGKTAVVEGFALRVTKGNVPPSLGNISVRVLDLGLLQAGAGVRGEFENRLKAVIPEVKSSPQPIILFIDEAHTMIGAGGPAGQGDAANLLKPALARGELRTIAATTWAEYKKYFEKDPALARRFQVVKVDEPDEATATDMLRSVVAYLEKHHQVRILDEAVHDAVRLSQRYISGRQLPDKAISVLDTACARVAIGHNATPPVVEDVIRQIERCNVELVILQREQTAGHDHAERVAALTADLAVAQTAREALEQRWHQELTLVRQMTALERSLEAHAAGQAAAASTIQCWHDELARLQQELDILQGSGAMVPTCVDSRVVAAVVSGWTGIPLGKMLTDELYTLLHLHDHMAQRIIGQPQALDTICRRIRTARASLDDPGKPVGVFLLVGPSGVGKTETALALADLLYGGERHIVVVHMSEYQEAHTVSTLKGAPPGYVGYGQGGVLTEAVRHNPYSVVLLDEVEKAHPDVMELFYQVFDKGTLEDSEGVMVNFKNTVILLTCNVGAEIIMQAWQTSQTPPDGDTLAERLRPALLKYFKPALLGRLVIVPYAPLGDSAIRNIVSLKLAKVQQRFQDNHRAALTYADALVAAIAARCREVDSGARNVDHILTQTLLPELAGALLERMARGEPCTGVHVSCDATGSFLYHMQP
jgi:type VI secretion system protein VasG